MIISDLFEMMLYRGDANHIEMFDIKATDRKSLFGPGLYLTSDPGVAHDYTAARGDERVYPKNFNDPESKTVKDLLRNYVMAKASEFNETKFKNEWVKKHMSMPFYGGLPSNKHRQLDDDMNKAKYASMQEKLKNAYAETKKELPHLRVLKQTTGNLVLVRKDRNAAVSAFNIPDSYVNRTLNADLPLSDRDLKIIRTLWLKTFPKDNGDMRDNTEKFVPFDKWVENYKKIGTRYAWRDDDEPKIGGKGENPSLDDIKNGTHGGYHVFQDSLFSEDRPKAQALIDAFMAVGYVGIEYFGGNKVGVHVRGGGGRKHRAFCFWDIPTVMKFRVDNHPLPELKKTNIRSVPRKYSIPMQGEIDISEGNKYSDGTVEKGVTEGMR